MTAEVTAVAAPAQNGERFARRVVTWCGVLVGLACFGFSFGNVLALGRYLGVPEWVAWLVAPPVDLTVIGLIVGIRHLSLRGVEGRQLRPARLMLVAAGLATLALNTAYGLFVRHHLGVVAYDSLAPLLLVGWAEVGPWFLRQFRAVATADTFTPGRTEEAATAQAGTAATQQGGLGPQPDPDPTHAGAGRQPTGGRRLDGRAAAPAAVGRAAGGRTPRATAADEQALLDRARALNAAHWQAHGRPISRDRLRAALGIGATRAGRLLGALAAQPPTSPPPGEPVPVPARPALSARVDQWAALRPTAPGGLQRDGERA